jgi:MFS family permease
LSWAAQNPSTDTLWPGLAGAAVLVPALRMLLPAGTLRAKGNLSRVVLARGLFAGAFFGVEAYIPLTLTAVHGYSPALAGLPLTVGAIGWSAASMWQGRHPDLSRWALMRIGFAVLAAGLAGMAIVAPSWGPSWLAAPLWVVAGAGMGLAFPSASVLALHYAQPNERGFAASALQVSDMMFSAAMVGVGGVLLASSASAAHPAGAMVALNLLMGGVAVFGAVLFRRA